ncbi:MULTISPECIES: hypothetical protein [Brevibacillus]|nr:MULTISPECIES: hypothetical protein [Brevibacillus]MCM3081066.1 hypothetical protein [Brevibacillus invocatus]MCM3431357.1 hypothetical protein [Brevibacillus invocatus]MDH4618756.1 hypothetical protein [Brevibacillus sp. AY1]
MRKTDRSNTSSQNRQHEEANQQPDSVHNDAPGYGDKKLEGPNRPST